MKKSFIAIILVALSVCFANNIAAQALHPTLRFQAIDESYRWGTPAIFCADARFGVLIGNDFTLGNNDLINVGLGADFDPFSNSQPSFPGADFHIRAEYHYVPEHTWDWYGLAGLAYYMRTSTGSIYDTSTWVDEIGGFKDRTQCYWAELGYGVLHHWNERLSGSMEIMGRYAFGIKAERDGEPISYTMPAKATVCLIFGLQIK